MIDDHLAACVLEVRQIVGPCWDIGRIESLCHSSVVDIEMSCVIRGIVNDVLEPALVIKTLATAQKVHLQILLPQSS